MHSARHVDEQCLYGATSAAEDAEERPRRRPALRQRPERRARVEQLQQHRPVKIDSARGVLARQFRRVQLPDSLNHALAVPRVRETRLPRDIRPTRGERPMSRDPIVLGRPARHGAVERNMFPAKFGEA